MASKSQKRKQDIAFMKFLSQHPDFKEEFSRAKVMDSMECMFLMIADNLTRFHDFTGEDIRSLEEFVFEQFESIGFHCMTDYFDELNEALKEETGEEIMGFMQRRMEHSE